MTDVRDYTDPICPECGAPFVAGLNCWAQMGAVCAWEVQDEALAALHYYTVAAFNIQHPSPFTDEARAQLAAMFREAVDQHLAGPEVRRRVGSTWEGDRRVMRPLAERLPTARAWPMTIADVYLPDRREGAAARVEAWAAAVRGALQDATPG